MNKNGRNRYDETLDRVQVTDEMRSRILERLESRDYFERSESQETKEETYAAVEQEEPSDVRVTQQMRERILDGIEKSGRRRNAFPARRVAAAAAGVALFLLIAGGPLFRRWRQPYPSGTTAAAIMGQSATAAGAENESEEVWTVAGVTDASAEPVVTTAAEPEVTAAGSDMTVAANEAEGTSGDHGTAAVSGQNDATNEGKTRESTVEASLEPTAPATPHTERSGTDADLPVDADSQSLDWHSRYNSAEELSSAVGFPVLTVGQLPFEPDRVTYAKSGATATIVYEKGDQVVSFTQKRIGGTSVPVAGWVMVEANGVMVYLKDVGNLYTDAVWRDETYEYTLHSDEPKRMEEILACVRSVG